MIVVFKLIIRIDREERKIETKIVEKEKKMKARRDKNGIIKYKSKTVKTKISIIVYGSLVPYQISYIFIAYYEGIRLAEQPS